MIDLTKHLTTFVYHELYSLCDLWALFSHRVFIRRSDDNLHLVCFLCSCSCCINTKFVIFLILIFVISILCIHLLAESYSNFSL